MSRYSLSALVIFAIGFILISIGILDHQIIHFDTAVASFIQQRESPALTKVMRFFTGIGEGWTIIVIILAVMLVLYIVLHHRKELVFLAAIMIGSSLLNLVLKLLFHRSRPVVHRIIEEAGYSFPSGHSMAAFSFYGALSFIIWKHIPYLRGRILLILLSALFILAIGISRIYLGVHYPSDVIGAYFISGTWLTAGIMVYQKYADHMSRGKAIK